MHFIPFYIYKSKAIDIYSYSPPPFLSTLRPYMISR